MWGGWVQDHQQKLSLAYRLAKQRMDSAATQNKPHYDQRAKVLPLLPGERVWVRDRNRRGAGKLCTWWDPEPWVVLEQVGDTGVVYKIQPEQGGRVQNIHRNSLKVCTVPPAEAPLPSTEPATLIQGPTQPLIYGFLPAPVAIAPVNVEPEGVLRHSTRSNFGQPSVRYRDLYVAGTANV